jgi:hypothetical protein
LLRTEHGQRLFANRAAEDFQKFAVYSHRVCGMFVDGLQLVLSN